MKLILSTLPFSAPATGSASRLCHWLRGESVRRWTTLIREGDGTQFEGRRIGIAGERSRARGGEEGYGAPDESQSEWRRLLLTRPLRAARAARAAEGASS